MLIRTTDELVQFCKLVLSDRPDRVAIDTEFVRNLSIYYPKLCLIQVAYGDKQCAIDVLEEDLDVTPLQEIFDDKGIFKVFHDCRQDLEALSLRFPRMPQPIFDTQIAAMLCECYDNSVGYSRLSEQFLGVQLNKLPFKRVDWSSRPLSEGKVRYALDDVFYLYRLYEILADKLLQNGRLPWLMEEMGHVVSPSEEAYDSMLEGMDFYRKLTAREAYVARAVIEWREKVAQFFNVGRNVIMAPKGILALVRDYIGEEGKESVGKYVKDCYLGSPFSLSEIVEKNKLRKEVITHKSSSHNKPVLDALSILLYSMCKKHGISQRLVASRADLIKFINRRPSNIIHGWRHEFFGSKAKEFLEGNARLLFSVENARGHTELVADIDN